MTLLLALLGVIAMGVSIFAMVEGQRAASALLAIRRETASPTPGQWTVLRGVIRCSSNDPPRSFDGAPTAFVRRVVSATGGDPPGEAAAGASAAPDDTSIYPVCDEVLFSPARLELSPPAVEAGYRSAQPEALDAVQLRLEPLLLLDSPWKATFSRSELERRAPEFFGRAASAAGGPERLVDATVEELCLPDGASVVVGGMLHKDGQGNLSLASSHERPAVIALAGGTTAAVERAMRCMAVAVFCLSLALAMWITPGWWLAVPR